MGNTFSSQQEKDKDKGEDKDKDKHKVNDNGIWEHVFLSESVQIQEEKRDNQMILYWILDESWMEATMND